MFDYSNTSDEYINTHVDRIVSICDQIQLNQVTILTGGNATGKSVIRKALNSWIVEKLGMNDEKLNLTASVSMNLRVNGSSSMLGTGLEGLSQDPSWTATSTHTLSLLKGLLKNHVETPVNEKDKRFVIIDELETGLSNEVQAGFCIKMNELLEKNIKNCLGVLVITHSKTVVKYLKHDNFINIEGMTEDEWVNREIIPVMPETLEDWSHGLFRVIQKRTRSID